MGLGITSVIDFCVDYSLFRECGLQDPRFGVFEVRPVSVNVPQALKMDVCDHVCSRNETA